MSRLNTYPEFPESTVELVRNTARQLAGRNGLTRDDIPDIEQELMLHLWEKKNEYSPEHPSGSSCRTFVSQLIAKKKVDIMRERSCEKRRLDHRRDMMEAYEEELFDDASDAPPAAGSGPIVWCSGSDSTCGHVEERVISKVLLEENLKKMPLIQQIVFLRREQGYSPLDISEELNISKTTVYDHLRAVILKLDEAGVFDRNN